MGRGKFKGKPTGHRHFSTPEEMLAGTSNRRPRTFRQEEVGLKEEEEEEQEESGEEEEENQKRKGTQGIIEIENPNIEKPKNVKAKDVDMGKTTELSRREREEIEKQKAHERYMRLQEQGKTEQARKDLGNWLLSVHYFSFQSTELMFSVIHNPIIYILLATC
ncbi:PP28 domain-containing protein [Citrus sinensis]|nr:PP28 domain-containing protein [Citrus sinensis]